MFAKYHDLIDQLKSTDPHFESLFDKHTALDQQIDGIQDGKVADPDEQLEELKKEKLKLKDSVRAILVKNGAQL